MIFADTVLINGKIFSPVEDGRIITGDTVLIKDGKIL